MGIPSRPSAIVIYVENELLGLIWSGDKAERRILIMNASYGLSLIANPYANNIFSLDKSP
jgi:hypothetical protein